LLIENIEPRVIVIGKYYIYWGRGEYTYADHLIEIMGESNMDRNRIEDFPKGLESLGELESTAEFS